MNYFCVFSETWSIAKPLQHTEQKTTAEVIMEKKKRISEKHEPTLCYMNSSTTGIPEGEEATLRM